MLKEVQNLKENIIPVILAGGTGTRLWPVSRPDLPKQFQPIVGENTLFQQTVLRLDEMNFGTTPIVMTNKEHLHLVKSQLMALGMFDVEIVCEPCCRDTAPAVVSAAMIAFKRNPKSRILTLPSDHRIMKNNTLGDALNSEELDQVAIVAFGLKPQGPATGYGYIKCGSKTSEKLMEISSFKEKPSLEKAEEYVKSGNYLWNSGMYLFSTAHLIDQIQKLDPELTLNCHASMFKGESKSDIFYLERENFEKAQKISIDHALMEKVSNAEVLEIDPQWIDVGSWTAVWECSDQDINGNVTLGNVVSSNSQNCYIRSENQLTAVMGLEDVIVVTMDDAVLIADKSETDNLKKLVAKMKEKNCKQLVSHSAVTRPWGQYRSIKEGTNFQVKHIRVEPGQTLSLQYHHHRSEHWTIVSGTAEVTVGNEVQTLKANDGVYIPKEAIHRIANPYDEPVEFIEVQCGSYLGEDDIVRIEDIYDRVV